MGIYGNSYPGFRPATDTAVVILSNLPDDYRLSATEMGAKLLREIKLENEKLKEKGLSQSELEMIGYKNWHRVIGNSIGQLA